MTTPLPASELYQDGKKKMGENVYIYYTCVGFIIEQYHFFLFVASLVENLCRLRLRPAHGDCFVRARVCVSVCVLCVCAGA